MIDRKDTPHKESSGTEHGYFAFPHGKRSFPFTPQHSNSLGCLKRGPLMDEGSQKNDRAESLTVECRIDLLGSYFKRR